MLSICTDWNEKGREYLKSREDVVEYTLSFHEKGENFEREGEPLALQQDAVELMVGLSAEEGSYFRVDAWFPTSWDGRLVGSGNGGLAGGLPIGLVIRQVNRQRVSAVTDMGTSRGEASGIGNLAVAIDFGHRATHRMSLLIQELCPVLYGEEARYRYFFGASTGGQQALSLAQRYPEDYDAILCGAPAYDRISLHNYFLWNYIASRDETGTPLFTEEHCDALADCAVEFMQRRGDGEKGDGFVTLPLGDKAGMDALVNYAADRLKLNEKQTEAYRKLLYGPIDVDGKISYHGIPCGSENRDLGLKANLQVTEPIFPFTIRWALGQDVDFLHFDFAQDTPKVAQRLSPHMDAVNPDLSAFLDKGGKLLIHSGTADPCVPFGRALEYARKVEATVGEDRVKNGFRFFLSPSFDHFEACCWLPQFVQTPDGRSLPDAMMDWYEKEIPVDAILCHPHGNRGEKFAGRILQPLVPAASAE